MQSADRALAILAAFSAARSELGVSELAAELGMHKSTVSRLLAVLQARGLVTSQWNVSETNRRVRCYTLTEQGRQQLRAELSRWHRFSAAVSRALQSRRPRTA